MKKKETNNNVLKWFVKEGAVTKEENLYIAPRAFLANSIINFIKKAAIDKILSPDEIQEKMEIVRLFLQKKVDLKWDNGTIKTTIQVEKNNEGNCMEARNSK